MSLGSFAKFTSTGITQPSTTPSVWDLATESVDADGILTRTAAGTYRFDEAGTFLVEAVGRFQDSSNGRHNPVLDIRQGGTVLAGSSGSGYNRNNNNPYAWVRTAALIQASALDTFTLNQYRDTDAPNGGDTWDWGYLRVTRVADSNAAFLHAGTPTGGAHGGDTPNIVGGLDVITESDSTAIELVDGDKARLKNARFYLGVYSWMNAAGGGSRTGRVSDVTFDGSRVAHSFGQAYQRSSSNEWAFPEGVFLVEADGTDQDVQFRIWGRVPPSSDWGILTDGSWSLSSAANASGFMIVELPASAVAAIFEDLTGGQTFSGSAGLDLNIFRTAVGITPSPFSKVSDTALDVTSATDVLAFSSVLTVRESSSGSRQSNATRWEVEGVDQAETEWGDYVRGDQSSQDHYNGQYRSTFLGAVSANDTFNLEKFDPGTDDGANDETREGGAFFIDLSSLDAAPVDSAARVTWAELETPDAARSALVTWSELETPDAPRAARITWSEVELPDAPRSARITWSELEIPDGARSALVTWAEMETPDAARAALVTWTELELPDAPTTDRRGRVVWSEMEVPDAPRRARVTWTELETPDGPRSARVTWTEFEIPDLPPRAAVVTWAEVETPDAARGARITWAEVETPDGARAAVVSWADLEIPDGARRARIVWTEVETGDAPRAGRVSWAELQIPDLDGDISSLVLVVGEVIAGEVIESVPSLNLTLVMEEV